MYSSLLYIFLEICPKNLHGQKTGQEKFPLVIILRCCGALYWLFAQVLKGATKLYFMYYSPVVIILFSTGLYKSVFSTYSFGKTSFSNFCVLIFRVSVPSAFNF